MSSSKAKCTREEQKKSRNHVRHDTARIKARIGLLSSNMTRTSCKQDTSAELGYRQLVEWERPWTVSSELLGTETSTTTGGMGTSALCFTIPPEICTSCCVLTTSRRVAKSGALAVMTVVGLHDFVKVSISASLRSFLLIMCIDAPESTTNSLSSGFNVDAGRHLFSGDEKNAALSCSFNLNTFLDSFHAASRAPCSCHYVSSCERSSNFGALGLRS